MMSNPREYDRIIKKKKERLQDASGKHTGYIVKFTADSRGGF